MIRLVAISAFTTFLFSYPQFAFQVIFDSAINNSARCRTEIDTLTKKIIYVDVDSLAYNEGGQPALMRKFAKLKIDSISNDFDSHFGVAFIVDQNGGVSGERIINNKNSSVGLQMISIAKSLKWVPAVCKGHNVPSIVTLPLQICLNRE